jgi:hypothetical protein
MKLGNIISVTLTCRTHKIREIFKLYCSKGIQFFFGQRLHAIASLSGEAGGSAKEKKLSVCVRVGLWLIYFSAFSIHYQRTTDHRQLTLSLSPQPYHHLRSCEYSESGVIFY